MRGRLDPLPSHDYKLSAPSPGSALNLSANTSTRDECLDASAREQGKGKAREIPENEYDGSHRHWRDN